MNLCKIPEMLNASLLPFVVKANPILNPRKTDDEKIMARRRDWYKACEEQMQSRMRKGVKRVCVY